MIKYEINSYKGTNNFEINFSDEMVKKAFDFHKSFPFYQKTKLKSLDALAKFLGVKSIYIKDESERFLLDSFKVLGASYAAGCFLAKDNGINLSDICYDKLIEISKRKQYTFTTASDGNHGKAVAWISSSLGQKAVINLPKNTAVQRIEAIKNLGASVNVTDLNYDDTVIFTNEEAKNKDYVLLQDTAWIGYEEIPLWIMLGYSTMVQESLSQIKEIPTHVFLQAGVGSMASSVIASLKCLLGNNMPKIIVVEPENANCFFRSAQKGSPIVVNGTLKTIMAGLSCGSVSEIAWPIINNNCDTYCSVEDCIAAYGMRLAANPFGCDEQITSGESGAVGLGLLAALQQTKKHEDIKKYLVINNDSVILFFNTEGVTDEENYRRVILNGLYPYFEGNIDNEK